MLRKKQFWMIGMSLCLFAGNVLAQQPVAQTEQPAAESEEAKAPAPVDGFGETYGEKVEREQSAKKAQEAETAKEEENGILAAVPADNDIDYGAIADVMFANPSAAKADNTQPQPAAPVSENVFVTLSDPTTKANLDLGRTIEIKIPTTANLTWNFDKEYKALDYVSDKTENGYFQVVFRGKAAGDETIYFDSLDMSDPLNVKVLETKMMVVKVGE